MSRSDFVALVPELLVLDLQENLTVVESPFPVPGFPVSMLWHERNHAHGGHRWLRDVIIELASDM